MSFQDQKFPIVLGTITALATGGMLYWGMKSGSAYETAKADYDSAVSDISRLNREAIPPTEDNRRGIEKSVSDFRGEVEKLQKAFDVYRATKLEGMDPTAFQEKVLASTKAAKAKFEQTQTEVPEAFYLGFTEYTEKLPQANQTGLLDYQLTAYEELFAKLAEAAPVKILNVHREPLPEESGKAPNLEGAAYRTHSIEISFSGREDTLRQFMASLDDSEKHFFVVRSLRVINERGTAPNAKDARFEQPKEAKAAGDNPFGGGDNAFVFPEEEEDDAKPADGEEEADEEAAEEEEEAPAAPADSGEILKQVLGSETIRVFLRIDLLQFLEPRALPKA
ncbi:MAG: Amuc_1100 family pilus-like protein [Akkermansiaceae bacterium]|jgi:hypothetical protein|nr:Amuc_1100 family pilus-like protein [Akkermansiaceae bacterium]